MGTEVDYLADKLCLYAMLGMVRGVHHREDGFSDFSCTLLQCHALKFL